MSDVTQIIQQIERDDPAAAERLLDIDAGLARLAEEDPEAAELVKLRLFAGLSVTEAGEMLGMSRSAAYRNWDYVRAWYAVHCGK